MRCNFGSKFQIGIWLTFTFGDREDGADDGGGGGGGGTSEFRRNIAIPRPDEGVTAVFFLWRLKRPITDESEADDFKRAKRRFSDPLSVSAFRTKKEASSDICDEVSDRACMSERHLTRNTSEKSFERI